MFDIRGYLLHITHYDPVWVAAKKRERPFDLAVGLEVVRALAENGYNMLLIDPKDGVAYRSHPELKRHYTQPMTVLKELACAAREAGLEVAIKLNFAQSSQHQHNHWFSPHHNLFDNDEYFERAFRIIDELVAAAKPERYFHIGMDEDHDRTITQYCAAITRLHAGLKKRKLKTVIWNDSACHWPRALVHAEKSLAAERLTPKDITHIIWDYGIPVDAAAFRRARRRGLAVWGAPGLDVAPIVPVLEKTGCSGIMITRWTPCIRKNRKILLSRVRDAARAFMP